MRRAELTASTSASHPGKPNLLLFAIIFAVGLVPILATPVLPLIDFYNHLARYFVLANIGHSEFLPRYYAENWSLLPNIGMDVIGAGLLKLLPPMLSGHILASLILLTIYSGVLFLNYQIRKSWTGSWLIAVLAVPLLYSYIFIWGFANFLFGLGLTLWACGWWLAMRRRPAIAVPVAALLAICIFLAHGLAFALYGLLVGALELGIFFASGDRRVVKLLRPAAALSVQAVIPALMFLSTTTAKSEEGLTNADESVRRLLASDGLLHRIQELALYRLETVVRVAEGPTLLFDVLTFASALGLLFFLARRGRVHIPKIVWPAIAIAVVLVAVTPPALFGVGYVADRMPLFLALIALAGLTPTLRGDRLERLCVGALVLLVVLRVGFITVDWQKYRRDFSDFQQLMTQIPPHNLTTAFDVSLRVHVTDHPRCEMYGPLLIALDDQGGPLFANATQQPLRLVGDLRKAVDAMPRAGSLPDSEAPEYFSRYIAAADAAGYYRYLVLCSAERLTQPLPAGSSVVAKTERFTLVRLANNSPAPRQ